MPNILITGAGGQLGSEFQYCSRQFSDWHFLLPDRAALDITDSAKLAAYFAKHQPDYCLNTAAYTAVDRAESEPEAAEAINVEAAAELARICKEHRTHLFHFSTDYVYQGDINRPLRETDPTGPDGVYARTKLAGEQAIQAALPGATIIRTSWVYSSFGHNFVKTMLRLGRERDELRVVFDQVGTPTYARDLAKACLQIIHRKEEGSLAAADLAGIFHYSNEGVCSWYDFALAIFDLAGIACRVEPIPSSAYPTPANRPHYSVLDKAKFKETFDIEIPHWREALRSCLAIMA